MRWRISRRLGFGILAIALAASIGYGSSLLASPATPHLSVTKSTLPDLSIFDSISVFGGHLVVSGEVVNRCLAAMVDPLTLRLSQQVAGSCDSPQLHGENVAPVLVTNESFSGNVRIAVAIKGSTTGYRLGPEVMPFANISGGARPQWTYGDGALWIYDVGPNAGNHGGAAVLRVSETTGAVENKIPMPYLYRPFMATNQDGLWIASSDDIPGPPALYHIGTGTNRPQRLQRGTGQLSSMYATGQDLYLQTLPLHNFAPTFWHFVGPNAAIQSNRQVSVNAPSPSASDPSGLLWGIQLVPPDTNPVSYPASQSNGVFATEINPTTGRPLLSTALPSAFASQQIQGLYFDHSFWVVVSGISADSSELFRVTA